MQKRVPALVTLLSFTKLWITRLISSPSGGRVGAQFWPTHISSFVYFFGQSGNFQVKDPSFVHSCGKRLQLSSFYWPIPAVHGVKIRPPRRVAGESG